MTNSNLARKGKKNGMYGVHRFGEENPFYGKKHSEETKKKISETKRKQGLKTFLGRKHSKKTKEFFRKQRKGRKLTEEWKNNLKKAVPKGDKSPHWKEKPKYAAMHAWVRKHKGKIEKCMACGRTKVETKLHWANIDHKYKRNLDDYISLCVSCHRQYDKKHGFWKKGISAKEEYDKTI